MLTTVSSKVNSQVSSEFHIIDGIEKKLKKRTGPLVNLPEGMGWEEISNDTRLQQVTPLDDPIRSTVPSVMKPTLASPRTRNLGTNVSSQMVSQTDSPSNLDKVTLVKKEA